MGYDQAIGRQGSSAYIPNGNATCVHTLAPTGIEYVQRAGGFCGNESRVRVENPAGNYVH